MYYRLVTKMGSVKVIPKIRKTKWLTYFIIAIYLQLQVSCSPTVNDGTLENGPSSQNKVLRRTIRSPQLFGKNTFSDLTQQLKPPTLNDFKEFREKMANLVNLTALLEQTIAAQKAAQTTFQNFIASIKDQITGITTAVNPDPGNYWLESKECGGILVSQTGRISYKLNKSYNDNERCVWTIRANYRSKIRIALTNGDLEDLHDYVSVTEPHEKKGVYGAQWATKRLKPGQTQIFDGPLIFISFVSDGSIRKSGFQLDFEGMGSNINTRTIYQQFHFTDSNGQFNSDNLSKILEADVKSKDGYESLKATVVVNPGYMNASKSKLALSIPEGSVKLLPDKCDVTSLNVLKDFSIKSHGIADKCCGETCDKNEHESSNGIMLGILSSSDLNKWSQFQINWSTETHVNPLMIENSCGGLLKGDSGTISYKADVPYENNERCLWIIQPGEEMENAEIKMQLLKDGFEYKYDYVSVAYLRNDDENADLESQFLYKSGKPVTIPAPFAFIQFYSDTATFGSSVTGFELIWEFKWAESKHSPYQFDYTTAEMGEKVSSCSQQTEPATKSNLFTVINPHSNDATPSILVKDSDSVNQSVDIFTSSKGNISKSEHRSDGRYESEDGTFIVLHRCGSGESAEVISWEKGTLASRTNADTHAFAESVDQCGEILHGDSGRISYKHSTNYSVNERCTWIIRAKSYSTITVQLMSDGFESCCDKVEINRVNMDDGTIDRNGVNITRENRFETLEGPVLLVTFFSDHSVIGTGFVLEFQTKGEEIGEPVTSLKYEHSFYLIDEARAFVIQSQDNFMFMKTFHFPQRGINATVTLDLVDLQTNECHKGSVALYKMSELPEYQLITRNPSEYASCGDIAGKGNSGLPGKAVYPPVEIITFSGPGSIIFAGKFENAIPDKRVAILFSFS